MQHISLNSYYDLIIDKYEIIHHRLTICISISAYNTKNFIFASQNVPFNIIQYDNYLSRLLRFSFCEDNENKL